MSMTRRKWCGMAAGAVTVGVAVPVALASRLGAAGATFEIYEDARKEYRWRLRTANGQVIATSGQGYKAKADCRHGVESVQKEAAGAKVVEATAKE